LGYFFEGILSLKETLPFKIASSEYPDFLAPLLTMVSDFKKEILTRSDLPTLIEFIVGNGLDSAQDTKEVPECVPEVEYGFAKITIPNICVLRWLLPRKLTVRGNLPKISASDGVHSLGG
jgi:hypothetical protein